MHNYFASGNIFRPHKDTGLPILDSISGTLDYFDFRTGKSASGRWFVLRITNDENSYNAFFDAEYIGRDDIDLLESLRSRVIRLGCQRGIPVINVISAQYEGDLRAELLKAVAAGKIAQEDLPALLEFSKGNDEKFALWNLFKMKIGNDDLEKVKNDLELDIESMKTMVERLTAQRDRLYDIYQEVINDMNAKLEELNSALIFLHGEESLHGTAFMSYGNHTDNLIPVNDGYCNLLEAFEKFKTRKGVFVICGNTIHKIHHAYLEDKGRAYLLGSSREFRTSKPEKIQGIIDEIHRFRKDL